MISEKDLKAIEDLGLDEKIARVERLLDGKEQPRAIELGLYLALQMALEIRNGESLGSHSGKIVLDWTRKYPAELVEQAIPLAKQFFTDAKNRKPHPRRTSRRKCLSRSRHTQHRSISAATRQFSSSPTSKRTLAENGAPAQDPESRGLSSRRRRLQFG